VWRAAKRARAALRAAILAARLATLSARNRHSSTPVIGDEAVVISLTSHGKRVNNVFYAIESIARGAVKPSRIILWLEHSTLSRPLPASLQRLKKRGLEIREAQNYGPHTKYYPYVLSVADHELPLVTADDDVLYPNNWLSALLAAGEGQDPNRLEIVCHRARRIELSADHLAPYASWALVTNTRPSYLHLATGVAGVLYPPAMLTALRRSGEDFRAHCLRVDDVWLHVVALRNGYQARQISPVAQEYPIVPYDKDIALWHLNLSQGNDEAIRATYSAADVATLREQARWV
jgi:hypothetical protein